MKQALTHNQAAAGAFGGRFAQLVRHGLLACVLASAGAGALAQERDRGPQREEAQQGVRERFQLQPQDQRFDNRAFEDRRRQIQLEQEQRNEANRRSGRMTPDERRDLRRQINEAGMDLYPNTRRR